MAVAREDTRSFAGEGMPFSMAYMVIQDNQSADFQFLGASLSQGDGATSRRVRLHRHAHYEVVFVLEGEFVQHLENGEFRYRAGDVVFLNRNVRHSEGYESDCVLVFVNLSPQLVEDLFFSTAHQLRPGAPQCSRGPIFQFLQENSRETGTDFRREYLDFFAMGGQGQAAAVLDAMAQELTMASTGYGFRIQGLLLELFAVLEDPGRYSLERIRVDARSEEFLYTRVARYLEANHGRATREELGQVFHYNGDYLNRVVKKFSGLTISQLGQRLYLAEAKRLLRETDWGISEIISRLGFVNRTYFYQVFQEDTGMTPKEYRARERRAGGFSHHT